MLATNLFSERTDPAAKMAPIETVPTDRMMAHAATDSMDLKGTVVHIPATSSPDESEEVTPTHDVMPPHTSVPQPSEAKQAVPAITLEGATEVKPVDAHAHAQPQVGSLAVPEQSEDRTFQQQIQNAFTPAVKPVTAAPAPTTLPEPSNVQSIITPLTSTASATSGLSYLTSFPSMVKLDTQLLMRELRLLGNQRPASQTDRVSASTTTTEHDRKDRSRTLRSMLPISARKSTDAGAGRRSEEEKIGSKKRPHPLKRRSSSIKRMSSVFGDWQVTNVRAANSNVAAENRGGADEAAGMSCELPVAAGTMQSPSLGGLDTVLELDPPPSQQELAELYEMEVLDTMRDKHKFGTLIKDANYERVVVVFIRHFFCGNCFGYVRALTNEMPVSTLETFTPKTKLIVIGCGDPVLVPNYIKMTGCEFEIYADPSRNLYSKIGFSVNTLAVDPNNVPKYVSRWSPPTFMKNLLISLGLAVKSKSVNAGKVSQNGGELVWTNGVLKYTHRMKHPADHIEIEELERILKAR